MIIRKAQLSDLDQIMSVEELSFIPQIREERIVFEQRILKCPELFLIFEENGKVAGYLSAEILRSVPLCSSELKLGHLPESLSECRPFSDKYLYISSFALLPEFRGNGNGKKAWNQALEFFENTVQVKGFLLLVNELWKGAFHIYRQSGFSEVSTENEYSNFFPTETGGTSAGILMIKEKL